MSSERRKIVFLGTHGQYNIGDELLLETFLWQLGPEHRYAVNTYDKAFTSAQLSDRYDIELIDTAGDRRAFLGHLRSCDALCFGGGSIIKELYKSTGRHRYSTLLMILATVTFANLIGRKPIAMFNVGVGPITKRGGRLLARAILSQVDLLSVRDARSHVTCMRIGLSPDSVHLATDAVFSADEEWLLGAPDDDATDIDGEAAAHGVVKVAINLNRDIENPDNWELFLERLAEGLLALHAQQPIELHALPMQTGFKEHDDAQVLAEFADRVPGIVMHRHQLSTHGDAARLIAGCDVLLSERLHAIVMASIIGVPSFALAYDVKVVELAAMLGIEKHSIDINHPFPADEVSNGLGALIADRTAIGAQVRERSAELRVEARANFEAAREWASGKSGSSST